jgi:dTDP-glucose pyrophosphorylase
MYKENIIHNDQTALEALNALNKVAENTTLFVLDAEQKMVGALTDGDIRRKLIQGCSINENIQIFMNPNFKYIRASNYNVNYLKDLRKMAIKLIPILDDENRIINIINLSRLKSYLPVDVVIMAGGLGKRLKPLTDVLPKPLLKIGEKPIIEHNIDRLISFGVEKFNITIRYLGEKIIEYFNDGSSKNVSIKYVSEDTPLGTFGAVGLVTDFYHEHIIIMNSDLLTNIDFEDFYRTFVDSGADMAVASTPYHVDIPYAIMEIEGNNEVKSLKEKPRYSFFSNAGIYLIKKDLLRLIPKDQKFDATDLMDIIVNGDYKLISYPILGYWLDIGRMEDYIKAQEDIKHLLL